MGRRIFLPMVLALASFAGVAAEREPPYEAMRPQVDEARRTFPGARARFAAGLPDGQRLLVVTRVYDERCWSELASIAVSRVDGDIVEGRFRTAPKVVPHYRAGDWYAFPDSQLMDWSIEHRDGRKEGNRLGTFLP
jgi:hypothetical protein